MMRFASIALVTIVGAATVMQQVNSLDIPKQSSFTELTTPVDGDGRGSSSSNYRALRQKNSSQRRDLEVSALGKKSSKDDEEEGDNDGLLLCVVDDRGFPIPRDNPEYEKGDPVYSDVTIEQATLGLSDAFNLQAELYGAGAGIVGGIASIAPAFGPAAGALAIVAGIMLVVSKLLPSGTSPELIELRNLFRELNSRLDVLSQRVETLFFQLRIDFADAQLDAASNILARVATSYSDYVAASTLEATEDNGLTQLDVISIQANHREAFRYV